MSVDVRAAYFARDTAIDELLKERAAARESKQWSRSDELRKALANMGVTVIDQPNGQIAQGGGVIDLLITQSQTIRAQQTQIDELKFCYGIMVRRDYADARRIADLLKENLELKYGTTPPKKL